MLYRHEEGEPYRKRFLQSDETNQEWAAAVGPLDVRNGFYYKVAAGDDETPEYRVQVRAAPLISEFLATYRYRDYVNRGDLTRTSRKLEALRGTTVTILARTNRVIKEGRLDFDGVDGVGDLIRAERVPDDPQALQFRMVLDRDGKYRLRFTSIEGEVYTDPTAHDVLVTPDLPPEVKLTEPAKDVTLPANGQLELKGEAKDDFGIARLELRLHVVGGQTLKSKPFMADKLGQPNFGTPLAVEYSDLLELSSLQDVHGKAVELKPGTVIEYWLEAADACDYPRPNVTASKPRYKITIAGQENNGQQQKDRDEARKRQKENEARQAEQMKQEKAKRDAQREKDKEQQKADDRQCAEERKQGKDSGEKKPGDKGGKPEDKAGGKDDPKEGGKSETKPGGKSKEEEKADETRKTAEKLQEAMKKKAEKDKGEQDKPGESRSGDDNRPGKGKEGGEKKPGDDKDGKENKPGEKRDAGGQDGKNPAGEKKEGGKPGEQGSARPEGKPDPKDQKGEGKQGADKTASGKQPGQGKEGQAPKPKPGETKDAGKGDPGKDAGAKKPESDPKPGDRIRQGESREAKTTGKPTDLKPDEGKDGVKPGDRPKGPPSADKDKPSGKTGEPKDAGGDKKRPQPQDAKPSDVADRARDLKSQDRQMQREAKRELKDIQDKARDPQAREAAKKALEEAKKDAQPGQDKPDPGSGGPGEKGEKKPEDGAREKSAGEAKGGEPPNDPTDPGGKASGKPRKPDAGKPEEGEGPGKGKAPADRSGENPGEGKEGTRRGDGRSGDARTPPKPEKPEDHRASMLQLEEFRKKVDRDILKDMKMSPEQFERFLRDYEELAKRPPKAAAGGPDAIAPPQRGGPLPSMGGGPRQGKGKTDDVRSQGRPLPPPGYRDSYDDFVRRLTTPPPK